MPGPQGSPATPATPPAAPRAEVVAEVRGPDGRYQAGNRTLTHRGPDRHHPRQIGRILMARALVAPQRRGGKLVPGAMQHDIIKGLHVIAADHSLKNRRHFLAAVGYIRDCFDNAKDSGEPGRRITLFLFPSEVEEEMKRLGAPVLKPGGEQRVPPAPARDNPLSGLEEIDGGG